MITIDHAIFHAAMTGALVAAPKSDIRHYLNGVYLAFLPRCVRISGTDGHRLFDVYVPATVPDDDCGHEAIASHQAATAWVKANKPGKDAEGVILDYLPDDSAPSLTITAGQNCANLHGDALIAGKFPDIDRVIPTDAEKRDACPDVYLNGQYMADAFKALKPFANKKYQGVQLCVGQDNDSIVFKAWGGFEWPDETPVKAQYVVMPMRR